MLLRGLTRESRHWGDFPDLLRSLPGAPRVVTLDLPGNGRLNTQPSPLHIEEMAATCRAALLQRGLPPPYHLLAILGFDSMAAIQQALGSPQGQATAGDLANFAQAGVELLMFDTKTI